MAQTNGVPPTPSTSSRETRRSRVLEGLSRLWSEWHVELLIGLLVAIAIFLLVERMQIRQTLLGWLRQVLGFLESFGGTLVQKVLRLVLGTTLSDLVGYVLLMVAAVVVIWRIRWRLITTPRLSELKCPHCQGELSRVHRRPADRIVSLFVPVARYRCRLRTCGWNGLRVKRMRHE